MTTVRDTHDAADDRIIANAAEHLRDALNGIRPRGSTPTEWLSGKAPQYDFYQGIYRVAWHEPYYVLLEFDYLNAHRSSGDVNAELTINVPEIGGVTKGHYQKTRLNLLADRSVTSFAVSLDKRLPELKLDWTGMLNQAVQWVLAAYRAGEPSVVLSDAVAPEGDAASLLPPLLAGDGITILFGDGGASKSYLALAVGASIHSGVDVIPNMVPTAIRNVAYLDWEWSAWKHRQRLERLWADIDAPIPAIEYMACRLTMREERDRIRRLVRDKDIGFLIVDSVAMAAGGAPEEAETAVGFFGAMRELGLPALCIAHVNRTDAKGAAEKPFGSSFWHNSARSTWYMRRTDESDTSQVPVGLFHRKSNDDAKHSPIGLRWHFDEGRTWIEPAKSALEDISLEAELPVGKRITLLLRGGPLTIHEIAEELGVHLDTVRKTLQRGTGKYYVTFPGKGGVPATWANAARE